MIVRLEGGPATRPGFTSSEIRVLSDRLVEMPEHDVPTMNAGDIRTGKQGSWAPDEPRRYDEDGLLILSWQGWR